MSQTITRLFDSLAAAQQAVIELERAGVPHETISLISHDADHRHDEAHMREPLDHPASAAATCDSGASGLTGALTHAGVSAEEAQVYAEEVRRGGTLVSARVTDEMAASARAALDTIPYVDIGVRRDAYRRSGWPHFDHDAKPLSAEEIAHQRAG